MCDHVAYQQYQLYLVPIASPDESNQPPSSSTGRHHKSQSPMGEDEDADADEDADEDEDEDVERSGNDFHI